MLVLTRKLQQQIKIGEQITVTILRVKGQTVRVGIDAPREVRVIRGELPKTGEAEASADAEETTILEARLVIEQPDAELRAGSEDGSSVISDESAEADEQRRPLAKELRAPLPFRLPQRKRYSRTGCPPLRVAMAESQSLAK